MIHAIFDILHIAVYVIFGPQVLKPMDPICCYIPLISRRYIPVINHFLLFTYSSTHMDSILLHSRFFFLSLAKSDLR
jgi:hypothetical protein